MCCRKDFQFPTSNKQLANTDYFHLLFVLLPSLTVKTLASYCSFLHMIFMVSSVSIKAQTTSVWPNYKAQQRGREETHRKMNSTVQQLAHASLNLPPEETLTHCTNTVLYAQLTALHCMCKSFET